MTSAARGLFFLAILISVAVAVAELWPQVDEALRAMTPKSVVVASALALVALGANVMAWKSVLLEMDHSVSVPEAGRIYLVGQLGKYLPGSLWVVVAQMELGLRAGIPRTRSFVAGLVFVGLAISSAFLVGLAAVPGLSESAGEGVWLLVPLTLVCLLCSSPPVLSRLVDLLLWILRRQGIRHPFSYRGVASVIGWSALAYTMLGAHLVTLAGDAAPISASELLRIGGCFALASVAGVFAFLTPSGFGVREVLLTIGLAPTTGTGGALAVALTSRLVITVSEVVAAAGAVISARRALGGDREAPTTVVPVDFTRAGESDLSLRAGATPATTREPSQ